MLLPATLRSPATNTSMPNLPHQCTRHTTRSTLHVLSLRHCRTTRIHRRGMHRQRARHIRRHPPRQHLRRPPHRTRMRRSRPTTQRRMRVPPRSPRRCRRGTRPSRGTTTSAMAATVLPQCPRPRHSNNRLPSLRHMARRSRHRARRRQHNPLTALYRPVRAMRRKLRSRAHRPTATSSSTRPPRVTRNSITLRPTPRMDRVAKLAQHMRTPGGSCTRRLAVKRPTRPTRRYPWGLTTLHPTQTRL